MPFRHFIFSPAIYEYCAAKYVCILFRQFREVVESRYDLSSKTRNVTLNDSDSDLTSEKKYRRYSGENEFHT